MVATSSSSAALGQTTGPMKTLHVINVQPHHSVRAYSSVKTIQVHDKMTMLEVKTKIALKFARKVGRISNLPNVGQLDPANTKIYSFFGNRN